MISVIVTTYNRRELLRETLDSVLAQDHPRFEVIVVDDGSTDDTPRLLESYGDRIRALRKENGGVASARNVGIAAAQGELLAFVDDDDLWLPQKLSRQQTFHDSHPEVGLIYCDCERFDGSEILPDPKSRAPRTGFVFREFVENYFIIFSTIVVPRFAIEKAGVFDEEYSRGDDVDFMARVLEHYPAGYIDEKLIRRRKVRRAKTAKEIRVAGEEQLLYVRKFDQRYGATGKLPRRWAARKRASAHMKIGQSLELEGDAKAAREQYCIAMKNDPLRLKAYRRWFAAPIRARSAHSSADPH